LFGDSENQAGFPGDAKPRQGNATPPLVLASGSPRRAELLREYGYTFSVCVAPVEEPTEWADHMPPLELAEALSLFKARAVAPLQPGKLILAGDTVVALDGKVFGKPADRTEAARMIRALAGTTQVVISGVALIDPRTEAEHVGHHATGVTMRDLSDDELEAYLDTGAWEGKAGAYGIQDEADAFVTRVQGSFTNVVGFPMELVVELLSRAGVPVPPEADSATARYVARIRRDDA
jgi:septum formation protein